MKRALALLIVGFALAACGESEQVAGTAKKSDTKPWEGVVAADGVHAAGDWKVGDQKSWEEHLRARAQAQNEYARSAPAGSNL